MRALPTLLPRYFILIGVTAGVTILLELLRNVLDAPLIILIYLLTAAISTTVWGLGPGLFAAVVSFLAFSYFFAPPIYSFATPSLQDVIALGIFLVIALIISRLVRRARNREQDAIDLYELGTALANTRDEQTSALLAAQHSLKVFQAQAVALSIQRASQTLITVQLPEGVLPSSDPQATAPIQTASGLMGQMRIWRANQSFSATEQRLLRTFAGQTALALERAALIQTENRAKVLEESDQLKSALLSSVSHELRTPLATIRAAATSLRNGEVDWDSQSRPKLLTAIDEEARHLDQLVGNLLDMSKIESGALMPDWQWNDLNEIVSSVLNRILYLPQSHSISINFPNDLPLLPVDYGQMEQVFGNLFNNSLKYAKKETEILASATVEADYVRVEITNEGSSVPEEDLTRIFDKFYRAKTADRVTGTGLGLSICKGIIDAHGGRMWAENLPGRFAFIFTLPLNRAGLPAPILADEADPL
jgi:two-component system, OmpR family, sensor histidine kinase KdpD